MESYKYKSWIFTWNADDKNHLLPESELLGLLNKISSRFVFQREKVTREHYQGYLKLAIRVRKKTLLNQIKAQLVDNKKDLVKHLTFDHLRGSEEEAIRYVTKSDTRIGSIFYSDELRPYLAEDLKILQEKTSWYKWQIDLYDRLIDSNGLIRTADDRRIIWITDTSGNNGKSKLVKYLVVKYSKDVTKLPFGTAAQIRAFVCSVGVKKVYFIDIPRTLPLAEKDYDNFISVIEDIKNGYVVSAMYGRGDSLLFNPPHVVIFSNQKAPREKMSSDRWEELHLKNKSFDDYSLFRDLLC